MLAHIVEFNEPLAQALGLTQIQPNPKLAEYAPPRKGRKTRPAQRGWGPWRCNDMREDGLRGPRSWRPRWRASSLSML